DGLAITAIRLFEFAAARRSVDRGGGASTIRRRESDRRDQPGRSENVPNEVSADQRRKRKSAKQTPRLSRTRQPSTTCPTTAKQTASRRRARFKIGRKT